MKKLLLLVPILFEVASCFCQSHPLRKKQTLVVDFILNDFTTPDRIKNTSLKEVLNGSWSKIREMTPGLALNYYRGITDHLDFMSTFGASFPGYNSANPQAGQTESFLLELDANANLKLLTDRSLVSPYLTAGTGISKRSVYWAAYIPLGAGVQVKLSEDSFIFTNFQYRIGITNYLSDHLHYSIGFGAPIGK